MTMTQAQMFESLAILTQAEETGVLGFAIAQNRRKLAEEVKEFVAKRDELMQTYGTDKGDGKFDFSHEAFQAFSAALRPYAEMTSDVSIRQVSEEVFCSGSLTSSQMLALDWMVREEGQA